MKEKQILPVSAVSNLEFAERGSVNYCNISGEFTFWTVYFTHEGEEKQGKLKACVYEPYEDYYDTIEVI